MTSRLVADGDRNAAQIFRIADLRLGRDEDGGRRPRGWGGVPLPVPAGGGDVHGPVAGAADVRLTPLFEALVGADLVRERMRLFEILPFPDAAELVLEPHCLEVPLLLGNPLVQPEMRADDELAHRCSFPSRLAPILTVTKDRSASPLRQRRCR